MRCAVGTDSELSDREKRGRFLDSGLDLHIKAMGLPEPVREHRFHDSRRWRFDFCWPDLKLAVEIEGGHWNLGRHQRAKGFQQDIEKYRAGQSNG
jgi:hypothetical protein